MKSLKELYAERAQLIADNRKLLGAAVDGKLTADQHGEYEKRDKDIDKLSEEINDRLKVDAQKDRLSRYDEMEREEPRRQTSAVNPNKPGATGFAKLMIDVGRHKLAIPAGSALAHRNSDEYLSEFDRYLAFGEIGQQLGASVSKDNKGGYLSPVTMTSRLIKFVDDNVFMRRAGDRAAAHPEAVSLGAVSYDSDPGDGDWTAEVPAVGHLRRRRHDVRQARADAAPPHQARQGEPEVPADRGHAARRGANFIGDRLGYKFGITEEKAFLTGSGVQQPLGVFVASNDGIPTSRDFACSSTTDFTGDDVINSLYALKPQYQDRATGLFSRDFVKKLRTKKDGNGQYLWQPGLVAGQPDRVLNRPYVQSEYVPNTFTTGRYIGMWGDFSWYWIQDSMGLTIQRLMELFQLKNQIGMLARKETDGMPVLAEAFSRLKLA
jgi:hypothetical protein